jgi:hypothetical protein
MEGRFVRVHQRLWMVAAAGLTVVGLTGCSMFGGDDSGDGKSADVAVEVADDGTVKDALTSSTRPFGGLDITIDVLRIKRFDKVMRLELAVTPRSHGATEDLTSAYFSDTSASDADGMYLLDVSNMKKYPVVRVKDDCVCSSGLSDFPLDRPTVLFADFSLAPDSVKKLNVVVPAFGVLPAVELS